MQRRLRAHPPAARRLRARSMAAGETRRFRRYQRNAEQVPTSGFPHVASARDQLAPVTARTLDWRVDRPLRRESHRLGLLRLARSRLLRTAPTDPEDQTLGRPRARERAAEGSPRHWASKWTSRPVSLARHPEAFVVADVRSLRALST